jgi:hypothetical protein
LYVQYQLRKGQLLLLNMIIEAGVYVLEKVEGNADEGILAESWGEDVLGLLDRQNSKNQVHSLPKNVIQRSWPT